MLEREVKELRRANEMLKLESISREAALAFVFAQAVRHRQRFEVEPICKALQVARSRTGVERNASTN